VSTDHSPHPGRRAFLGRTSAAVGIALLPTGALLRSAAAQGIAAGTFASFAESVELSLVGAYDVIVERTSEQLRPLVDTYRRHHADHAEACAELAGADAGGEPNAALSELLAPSLAALSGQGEALAFARALEDQVAATYAYAATSLDDPQAAGTVTSIMAVEASHAASLRALLDEPVEASFPDGPFDTTDIARGFSPDAFPRR
jgi:hypothetical protein